MRKVLDWKFFLRIAVAVLALSVFLSAALAAEVEQEIVFTDEAINELFAVETEGEVEASKQLSFIAAAARKIRKMNKEEFDKFMKEKKGMFSTLSYKKRNSSKEPEICSKDDVSCFNLAPSLGSEVLASELTQEFVLSELKKSAEEIRKQFPKIVINITAGNNNGNNNGNGNSSSANANTTVSSDSDAQTVSKTTAEKLADCIKNIKLEHQRSIAKLKTDIETIVSAAVATAIEPIKGVQAELEAAKATIEGLRFLAASNETNFMLGSLKMKLDSLNQQKSILMKEFRASQGQKRAFVQRQLLTVAAQIQMLERQFDGSLNAQKFSLSQRANGLRSQVMEIDKELQTESAKEDKDAEKIAGLEAAKKSKIEGYWMLAEQAQSLNGMNRSISGGFSGAANPYQDIEREISLADEQQEAEYERFLSEIHGGRNFTGIQGTPTYGTQNRGGFLGGLESAARGQRMPQPAFDPRRGSFQGDMIDMRNSGMRRPMLVQPRFPGLG